MQRILGRIIGWTAAVLLVVVVHDHVRAADELKPETVLKSIEKGKQYLISQQNADGSFQSQIGGIYPTGPTALATLALLNVGMTPQDPPVQKALEFLRAQRPPTKTYEAGLQLMVFAAAKDGHGDRARMATIVAALEAAQDSTSAMRGGWHYDVRPNTVSFDHSNAQYAVLGLREAAFAGIPTSRKSWELTREHWTKSQEPDGGWSYTAGGGGSSGSMSVAGIASLVMADSMLPDDSDVGQDGFPDCCREEVRNEALERGLNWLRGRFAVGHNIGDASIGGVLYYLYGLERAGRLSGLRFMGNHDWFREGAKFLINGQGGNGNWSRAEGAGDGDAVVGTSFALLFLSKGMAPVLINKLKFGPPAAINAKGAAVEDWNRHRHDVHNLTDLISGKEKWPKLVTWQVVEMDKAVKGGGVADLMQAPVLFMSGRDKPVLTDPEVKLLREYIDAGGFIFAVNNCNGTGFDEGFRELIKQMYPDGEAELKKLAPEHPIFRSEYLLSDAKVDLWGVDFGCRTAIVYSPDDIGCGWNKWCVSDPPKRSPELKGMISKSTRIGINVIAYATGREPPNKLDQGKLAEQAALRDRIEAGLLQIAQLKHTGGWDTAPHALRNMLVALNETAGLAASTKTRELAASDANLFNYPIAYMHGRHAFDWTRAERERLKQYLANGGVLFADSCCSATLFDKSFRKAIEGLFPDQPLTRIPITHEIFSEKVGNNVRQVHRRGADQTSGLGVIRNNSTPGEPHLEGIEINGRYVVIYSKYDLSCALERQAAIACEGYVAADATKLAVNIILYSLLQDLK
ncbi:MAG: DUF4159 domain-containing protein [Planctomycetaceae bacterium]